MQNLDHEGKFPWAQWGRPDVGSVFYSRKSYLVMRFQPEVRALSVGPQVFLLGFYGPLIINKIPIIEKPQHNDASIMLPMRFVLHYEISLPWEHYVGGDV
jgi:hypothetical protein